MEKNNTQKTDSVLVGTIVWTILFWGMGFFKLIIRRNFDWLAFLLGALSLIALIYILRKTRTNLNERHEDERKKYLSEKSSSISYRVLFGFILILYICTKNGGLTIGSQEAILIILSSALIIKFIAYLLCKYKY